MFECLKYCFSGTEGRATLCDGMEHAGLDQDRRALVASPVDMSWA
jgi:tRNA pseudouridine13 synthase